MPKIKLELNEPLEASLKYATGKHYDSTIPGKAGAMMFSLKSGDCIFLEEDICDEPDRLFADARIGAGEPFRLTVRKRNGQRYYELKSLSDAAEPQPDPPSREAVLLEASITQAKQRKAVTPQCAPPVPVATNNRGTAHSVVAPTAPTNVTAPDKSASYVMGLALMAAVDACIAAQNYAHAQGFEMEFDCASIQKTGCTIYIDARKDPLFAERLEATGTRQWRQ